MSIYHHDEQLQQANGNLYYYTPMLRRRLGDFVGEQHAIAMMVVEVGI